MTLRVLFCHRLGTSRSTLIAAATSRLPSTSGEGCFVASSMDPNSPPEAKGNRARGWILVVLGPVLSIAMAVISFYLWQIIYHPGQPGGHSRWTGSHEMTFNAF